MALKQDDIIYFIITDRFFATESSKADKENPKGFHGGNFQGIIEKIPYLKKLGITALWITPVYKQINDENNHAYGYHGYWPLDFNSIEPHIYVDNGKYDCGSKLYLKDLVDELHKNGIKLVLDMVVNHTGLNHPGLTNAEHNPTPVRNDWFIENTSHPNSNPFEQQLHGLPEFNLNHPDVCDYHIQTIISWIKETGIDAIRIDTAKRFDRDFWNYYKTHIKGRYPEVSLIGEVLLFSIEEISYYQQNKAFDSFFDFPLQRSLEWVFAWNNSMETFVSAFNQGIGILEKDTINSNHNKLVTLLDNHDMPSRFMTTIMYAVNQDVEDAAKILKLSLSFLFTIRGIPQIYYGTEIAMQGAADPENRKDFEWEKFTSDYQIIDKFKIEKDIFEHTCKLIRIRKENPALTSGSFDCLYVDHFQLVYLRYCEENVVIVIIHNGWYNAANNLGVNIDLHGHIPQRIKQLIRNKELTCQLTGKQIQVTDGKFEIKMNGKSALILK